MGEIKKFPGRTILSQILKLIPGQLIHAANRKLEIPDKLTTEFRK
jgi:hypothetical protein